MEAVMLCSFSFVLVAFGFVGGGWVVWSHELKRVEERWRHDAALEHAAAYVMAAQNYAFPGVYDDVATVPARLRLAARDMVDLSDRLQAAHEFIRKQDRVIKTLNGSEVAPMEAFYAEEN